GQTRSEDAPAPESIGRLVSDYKQVTCVLRIDLPVPPERRRRVGRAESQLLKDLLLQSPTLIDGKEIPVLVVGINNAVRVDRHRVHTPLKAVRMIVNARHVTKGVTTATERVRVLEPPLDTHVRVELCDEVLLGVGRVRGGSIRRTDRLDVTVRPGAVVIVFDHNRVGVAVAVDARSNVPAEFVRALKLPC